MTDAEQRKNDHRDSRRAAGWGVWVVVILVVVALGATYMLYGRDHVKPQGQASIAHPAASFGARLVA